MTAHDGYVLDDLIRKQEKMSDELLRLRGIDADATIQQIANDEEIMARILRMINTLDEVLK